MKPFKPPTYVERLAIASEEFITRKGQMFFPEIQHDSWCKGLKGGDCDCVPDIYIETDNGRFEVTTSGKMKKVTI